MKGWEVVNDIKVLFKSGENVSEVSRHAGVDRKTARKYRDMTVEQIAEYRKKRKSRPKKLGKFAKFIEDEIERMAQDGVINAQAMFEKIKAQGYQGAPRSVRRYVSSFRHKVTKRRTYKPFETPAGQQAMVDLGEKRGVRIYDGKRTMYFVAMVLSYSRKKYAEWYDHPIDTETFIRFHQSAFEYLGGIPREIVYDQTKLAVIKEEYGEIEFNEAFYGFSNWSDYKPYICEKWDPETKGKVESVVRYMKRSFLPGRSFADVGDLDCQWKSWLDEIGDAKPHETTGRPPLEMWAEEKPQLQPLTERQFTPKPAFRVQQAYDDGLVKVLGNRYSVPKDHHGKKVKIRITEEQVEIWSLAEEMVYSHWRSLQKGKRFIVAEHYEKDYETATAELTRLVLEIFADSKLTQALKRNFPRHYREQCKRLIRLKDQYDTKILRQACQRVLEHHCVSYKNLKNTADYLQCRPPLDEDDHIVMEVHLHLPQDIGVAQRSPAYYDQVAEVTP
jgi:transposase